MSRKEYNILDVERKWQKWWAERGIYKTKRDPRKKYYVLEMFPYPSGDLHMGHLKNYVIGDVVARVKMMEGYDVLHPMGWDAFGLPAENAAIKHGIHPKEWTYKNIETFRNTLKSIGISYDWDKEIATCESSYYKWTQWLFILLYKKGLAYRKKEFVNWCPTCKTVLANEQVVDGKCERCKTPVVKKELEQWFFKITEYADRLVDDLKLLQGKWPENIIKQQENWIGRSYGTKIVFKYKGGKLDLPVFTTRADTLFGVTFITIAPEHEILKIILNDSPYRDKVEKYIEESLRKTEVERTSLEREKSGIFTGTYAVHPFTEEKIPIWVGDYVLASYGTGIVMGVPAHDQRDFEFAKKFDLPIKVVIKPVNGETPKPEFMEEAFEDYGIMVNSGEFTGLTSQDGIKKIQEKLKEKGLGGEAVSYRLRDWLISRQRYWGAPIPVVHCERCGIVPVDEKDLPVKLPENIKDFKPKGRSPLEDVPEFMDTTCPRCGGPAKRDPDTMDTFVDSSWYYFRYIDPNNEKEIFSPNAVNKWMPVDQYIGGAEHATKHLIYARFINKVLYDEGLIKYLEPFENLFTQGLVHKSFYYCRYCGRPVKDEEVKDGKHVECGSEVVMLTEMMSKSRGNIVPVGPFVKEHGADVARITILFAGPAEKDMIWSDAGVEGAKRFINRVWRVYSENEDILRSEIQFNRENMNDDEKNLYINLQRTIYEVKKDSGEFHFNTALARIMEFINALYQFKDKNSPVFKLSLRNLAILIAPFAPHLGEELWHMMGNKDSVFQERFPEHDPEYLHFKEVEIPVQVNGKVRGRLRIKRGASEEEVFKKATSMKNVQKYIKDKEIIKKIYIKDRLLNIVVK